MRRIADQLVYSPSDLINFMDSPFDSWMDRYYSEYPDEVMPDERDESLEILAKHGNAHEAAFLTYLQKEGYDIAEIYSKDESARLETIAAMRDGREIIYQGFLRADEFAGLSDFLVKVDGESELGDFHYEVWDTKLSKKAKPYFVVQLCCYAEMLERIQGRLPGTVRIVLGDLSQKEFRTREYFHHYIRLKRSFLELQRCFSKDNPPENRTSGSHSRWKTVSEKFLEDRDHLSRVANIRKSQIDRLTIANIHTMTALAESEKTSIPDMTRDTFDSLKKQAKLQIRSKQEGRTVYEVLPVTEGKGLAMLPPASFNDVYFDMEGYPHMTGGLEYLWGAIYEVGDSLEFKDWWAHDRAEEKIAFENFIDWVYDRWQTDPGMHIYHYAAYEVSAVRRLAGRHSTRMEEVDELLRHRVFVDLFHVVRQGLRVGEPSYSIKYVEHLYRDKRSGTVAKATDSVVFYERWIECRDGLTWQESPILKEIRDYNELDCISTQQLALWLRSRQKENNIVYSGPLMIAPPAVRPPTPAGALAMELMESAKIIEDPETKRVQELLAGLLEFHRREDKPMWWRRFERQNMLTEELYDDLDCLAGLTWTRSQPIKVNRSLGYWYSFDPNQDTKLQEGDSCLFAHSLKNTRIDKLDRKNGRALIVVGKSQPVPPEEISLIPDEYVDSKIISGSIYRICERWAANKNIPKCLSDLLYRKEPDIENREPGTPVADATNVRSVANAVLNMQNSCLSIQGPPGTGKTYTASHTIVHLLRMGLRVGITSNSHKAIDNLLSKVVEVAREQGVPVRGAKIAPGESDSGPRGSLPGVKKFKGSSKFFDEDDITSYNLIAGTAWLFSSDMATCLLNHLFVDEAGQVSLANLTAMSSSCENLVLLGDQMQLEQPTEGSHPGESGQSCLEYLLQERATIADNEGIFLGVTRRMHPDICEVISSAVYDSRLKAHEDNSRQLLVPPGQLNTGFEKKAGIVWCPVTHAGNVQSSEEEVDAVEDLINVLLKCCVSDKNGAINVVTMEDILIVAPYNMQVRKIAARIPGARVASIDKFQGQEAPIVILSMCASEGSSSARGLDFLFSRSRLNVAISRAKTLAFVVGSPELLQTPCTSLNQMKLISFFCQIVEAGKGEFDASYRSAALQRTA
jgi:uncharacterized protein